MAVPSPPSTLGIFSAPRIGAQAGLGDPLQSGNDRLVALGVFELDHDLARKPVVDKVDALDIAFVKQDVRDRLFHVGSGDFDLFMLGGERVPDSCKHICDRICHDVPPYQLAFFTPGICPLYARLRKQIRQMPYLRRTACGRPQMLQRVYARVENFGVLCCLLIIDFLAMFRSPYFLKGIPIAARSSLASSSVFAVVTKQISKPRIFST